MTLILVQQNFVDAMQALDDELQQAFLRVYFLDRNTIDAFFPEVPLTTLLPAGF